MSNSTIDEIKDRLNIVDVIGSYIPLKKAGTNYKATCPFHQEKSASLMVSPSKQIWHCFGCGEGGNVFGFVMRYENMDFPEALRILAERAGVTLPKYSREDAVEDKHKVRLTHINDLTAKFYNKVLGSSSTAAIARKYLKERGLNAATIEEWQIGFAPNDFHVLEKFLLKKGFKDRELVEAGVSSESQKNTRTPEIFDRFFNRVTFPIKNYAGDVVAFTARILDPLIKAAKYINSPETAVYSKGKVIFGLYQAKQAIRKEDCAVVVEGNMDVIACHQAGFKNVVGSSGTAFTYEQLQILSRLTKNLKFAFDADAAGDTATKRALDLALQQGFSVYIVKISGAKDPDELIKKNPKAFEKAVADAKLYIDYFFEKSFENYDPNSVQQKKQIAAELLPLLQKLSDPLDIAHYIRLLSQRLAVSEKTIYELLAKSRPAKQYTPEQNEKKVQPIKPFIKSKSYQLEEKLLGYALFREPLRAQVLESVDLEAISDPKIKRVFEELTAKNPGSIEPFIDGLGDLAELAKLALFVVESEYSAIGDNHAFDREFTQVLKEYKTNITKIKMSRLVNEMIVAEQKQDKLGLARLNQKFLELSQALKDITYEA